MKVLFPKLVFLVIYLCVYSGPSYAQKTVLVNGDATKVVISNSDISEIKGQKPGYMNGYESPSTDVFTKVPPRLGNQGNYVRPSTPVATTTKKEPLLTDVKSVSFAEDAYEVNNDGQKFLDIIANTIKSGEVKTILLKTYYKSEDNANISLTRRRLNACKRYLESKGVVSNVILTSMVAKDEKSNDIAVLMK